MSADASTTYDTVAYPSQATPQTHPDHLATLATVFGMTPAAAGACRVLELGCGDGGNLIPMAFGLPQSTFVGVDLSSSAIAGANDTARGLGLTNVAFYCADLLDWTAPDGSFDYVVAHGLFSWVPEAVRLRMLELCAARLAPQGVAYISYNALPGCRIRGMLGEMMRFHTQSFPAPAQKISQAKALLRLLLASQAKDSEYSALLKKEAQRLLDRRSDAILFHDDLAEINQAYYFHEFSTLAGQYGLQFLAEADFFDMQDWVYPAPVVEALKQFSGNIVLKEQYLDFLKCRRFRQTLLCRDNVRLNRDLMPGLMRRFLIASEAKPKSARLDLSAGVVEGFTGPRGTSVQFDHPLPKAALLELQAIWPRALPFAALLEAARNRLGSLRVAELDKETEEFAEIVLSLYAVGLVELHLSQAEWTVAPGERPVLSPIARVQLLRGQEIVASLRHDPAHVDLPIVRETLLLLDGTRDVNAVAAALGQRIESGELLLPAGADKDHLRADVNTAVRDAAARALFIG